MGNPSTRLRRPSQSASGTCFLGRCASISAPAQRAGREAETTAYRPKPSGSMRAVPIRRPPGTIMMSMPSHGTRETATVIRSPWVRNCRMHGGYTTCWAMCGSGATMDCGSTRRMRWLIRWAERCPSCLPGRQLVRLREVHAGGRTRLAKLPATTPATLASAVRVQEDRGVVF